MPSLPMFRTSFIERSRSAIGGGSGVFAGLHSFVGLPSISRLCRTSLAAACLYVLMGAQSRADEDATYALHLDSTHQGEVDASLKTASQLEYLRKRAPVAGFALIIRARQDIERLQSVLESFGYYDAVIKITINDHDLYDPDLVDTLSNSQPANVHVTFEMGPQYHLRNVTTQGELPPKVKLHLSSGAPAVAAKVIAAGTQLLTDLQEQGYALAKVNPPEADLDPDAKTLDVAFKVDVGPLLSIGAIDLKGLHGVHASFVRHRLSVKSGQLYRPSKIEDARQDLMATGVFSGVSVRAADIPDADRGLPLLFDFQERKKHIVALTGAYSTDLGASVKTTWSDRNLFGNAEQLNLSAAATNIGGTAINSAGYEVAAQVIKPDFRRRDQSLEFDVGDFSKSLEAYDQKAITAGVALNRIFSPRWNGSIGVAAEEERITQQGVKQRYTLVSIPFTAHFDSTSQPDLLLDPLKGVRVSVTVKPTKSFGGKNPLFVNIQASASTYFDLAKIGLTQPDRSVIAARAMVGSILGATALALPPDARFYGGGTTTVRGFKYQSIGPLFPNNDPVGGAAVTAMAVEYRQRIGSHFGFATFVDAGQVTPGSSPFASRVRYGAGGGIRYYTPIGPVRIDVAFPVNRPPGGDRFELYIGLGQAF